MRITKYNQSYYASILSVTLYTLKRSQLLSHRVHLVVQINNLGFACEDREHDEELDCHTSISLELETLRQVSNIQQSAPLCISIRHGRNPRPVVAGQFACDKFMSKLRRAIIHEHTKLQSLNKQTLYVSDVISLDSEYCKLILLSGT